MTASRAVSGSYISRRVNAAEHVWIANEDRVIYLASTGVRSVMLQYIDAWAAHLCGVYLSAAAASCWVSCNICSTW